MSWTAEAFVAEATSATGFEDFGNDGFREGLAVLLAAAAEAELPADAQQRLSGQIRAALETRLQLVALRKARPQIAAEPIEGPLVVIGLPRTGTSALVDLMAQDPAARAPLQWEVQNLIPPAEPSHWADDPRIAALEQRLQQAAAVSPVVALGLHAYGGRLPDECNSILNLEFWSPSLCAAARLPRYSDWLATAQPVRPYRSHRWVLQHLQHHGPAGRWTLKSPFHLFALPDLLAEYPEAMLVQTHRDPLAVLPSMCGLYAAIRGEGPGGPRRRETGRELCALWGEGLRRAMAAREDPAVNARVFDVSHRALAADPMAVLEEVYARFALPFSEAARGRVRAWADQPAQHRSAVRFSLDEFGLTEADVQTAFGEYRERFGRYF